MCCVQVQSSRGSVNTRRTCRRRRGTYMWSMTLLQYAHNWLRGLFILFYDMASNNEMSSHSLSEVDLQDSWIIEWMKWHTNWFYHCIVLYCIVLYCIVLYCIVLHCIVLYCIVLYCIVLYCIVLYCIELYCIILCCIVLYCVLLYCIVLFCILFFCILFFCIILI